MYADDLILLSASVIDLQKMLHLCDSIGTMPGLNFNALTSKCLFIGPNQNILPANLSLGNFQLPWVKELDYLGIRLINAKTFQIDLSCIRRKFFASVNSILSRCCYTSDMVKLKLLESHCLPILLYATESLNLPKTQILELNSWWNSVYRNFFNYNKWESVRTLISMLDRLDLCHIINLKSLSFIIRMSNCINVPDSFRSYFLNHYNVSNEYATLFMKFDCYGLKSIYEVRSSIYNVFKISCTS